MADDGNDVQVFMLTDIIAEEADWRAEKRQRTGETSSVKRTFTDATPLRLFGRREDGTSISVLIRCFRPYFWVAPPQSANWSEETVKAQISNGQTANGRSVPEARSITAVSNKHSMYKLFADAELDAYRVEAHHSGHMAMLRSCFPAEYMYEERAIDLPLRFLIDTACVPCGWVKLAHCERTESSTTCNEDYEYVGEAGGLRVEPTGGGGSGSGGSDELEVTIWSLSGDTGRPEPLDAELANKVAPLRTTWFDIECISPDGSFPDAEKGAECVMISLVECIEDDILCRRMLHLREIEPQAADEGVVYEQCADEKALLNRFGECVAQFDADLVGGFNVGGFDFPFVAKRATLLGAYDMFCSLSRVHRSAFDGRPMLAKLYSAKFESAAHSRRENESMDMHGRATYDMLELVRRNHKNLRAYTLNSISEHFLKDKKDDVHHSVIPKLYHGSLADRLRLARYCVKDSVLPARLDERLCSRLGLVEMARVTGVTFRTLLERGQQIKVVSQLARVARDNNMLIPLKRCPTGYMPREYVGAKVIDPKPGYYEQDRVMVLDFASLYPSIQTAMNYSYETLIPPHLVSRYSPEQYTKSPAGHCFLTEKAAGGKGMVPRMHQQLLGARKLAKKAMKAAAKAGDARLQSVFNSRQLALKVSANSIYGFMGVGVKSGGMAPLFEAAESTTLMGQQCLQRTADFIMSEYAAEKPAIVYGDTDSVFVTLESMRGLTLEQVFEKMNEMGERVTQEVFGDMPPMLLEAEKVFVRSVFQNVKKRYIGAVTESASVAPHLGITGLEMKRRENAPYVATTLTKAAEMLFLENARDKAYEYLREAIRALYLHRVPLEQLLLTKGLSREPEEYDKPQPHSALVKKMRKRDVGSAPRVGDRVMFVMVSDTGGSQKTCDKAEDPLYMLAEGIEPDHMYYLNSQLRGPIERIFTPVYGAERIAELFNGEHTRRVKRTVSRANRATGIASFFKPLYVCRVCGEAKQSKPGVCHQCTLKVRQDAWSAAAVRHEQLTTEAQVLASNTKQAYEEVYRSCQECQGLTAEGKVECMARDCAQLYKRAEAKQKMEEAVRDIEDLCLAK